MIVNILTALGYFICLAIIYLLQKELDSKNLLLNELASSVINLELSSSNYKNLIENLQTQNELLEQSVNLMEKEIEEIDSEYTQEYDLLKNQILTSIQELQLSQESLIQKLNDKDII
jgi:predicted RNase H-like nuclease (RuvC/YqgF family)